MNYKDLRAFIKVVIPSITPHIERVLGPMQKFRISVKPTRPGLRSAEVPFNVPQRGLFEFYAEGFYERFERPLYRTKPGEQSEIIFGVGFLLYCLIHDLIHIYQAERKEYKGFSLDYRLWIDGLAEYATWRVLEEIYPLTNNDVSFWTCRLERSSQSLIKAFKGLYFKNGIKRALVRYLDFHRQSFRHFRVAAYFNTPTIRDCELAQYMELFLRRRSRRKFFSSTPYSKKRTDNERKDKKIYWQIWMRYALGWVAVTKLVEGHGLSVKHLLLHPMTNAELLEKAGLSNLKRITII